jgi:polysaccharide pyruvyl transferase CsaB
VEVFVSAWVGSTNLGDEMVFRAMVAKLQSLGASVTAASLDPADTARVHDVRAIRHTDLPGVVSALASTERILLGGGGLLQDETSHLNLPYHLWRPAFGAFRAVPFAGVGLGAGPFHSRAAHLMTRSTLRRAVAVTVRDGASQRLLAELGVPSELAADPAVSLPSLEGTGGDWASVALRPAVSPGKWRPASAGISTDPDWIALAAAALDGLARATGLWIRLVAMQADRDGPLHDRVADRMTSEVSTVRPGLDQVVSEIASGRLVVAQRYHAVIAAALGNLPVVLVGYSPKVRHLAGDLGPGARLVDASARSLASIPGLGAELLASEATTGQALEELRRRERENDRALERLLEAR